MSIESQRPETLALHAGWRADPTTGSVAVPIQQSVGVSPPRAVTMATVKAVAPVMMRAGQGCCEAPAGRLATRNRCEFCCGIFS